MSTKIYNGWIMEGMTLRKLSARIEHPLMGGRPPIRLLDPKV